MRTKNIRNENKKNLILRCSYSSKQINQSTPYRIKTVQLYTCVGLNIGLHMCHNMSRHMVYAKAIAGATYGKDGEYRVMKKSGLSAMTLRDFISLWSGELTGYYGEDFGSTYGGLRELSLCPGSYEHVYEPGDKTINDTEFGDTVVFVLADLATNIDPTWVPPHIRKKMKRAGRLRRNKLRNQWAYENPLNRIHGFLILKEVTNSQHKQTTMCIDTICSTYFTDKRGIGSDLMMLAKDFSMELGAHDIVLEVANEFSAKGFSDEVEEESEEETDEESEEETDEDSDEECEETDEEDDTWTPDDDAMSILSDSLWKKCMRKSADGRNVYYNLDEEYIEAGLWNYFHCAYETEDETEMWSGTQKNIVSDKNDPKETEYGGYWYRKGKSSQSKLMKFYEMFGFKEDPEVHTDWCVFSEIPYPSMRLSL